MRDVCRLKLEDAVRACYPFTIDSLLLGTDGNFCPDALCMADLFAYFKHHLRIDIGFRRRLLFFSFMCTELTIKRV
jgi:hypothetical protein